MFNTYNQASYRAAVTSGATQVGLLLVVYDAIAEDLRQAGKAAAAGQIARRCTATNHALTLVGHLESWLAFMEDPPLATALQSWYGYLREQFIALQVRGTEHDFAALAMLVLEVRSSWSAKEQALNASVAVQPSPVEQVFPAGVQTVRSGWSA